MHGGTGWLLIAPVLGLVELAAPGLFLIFIAFAAAMTGLALLAAPALPLAAQLASVAIWSAVAVSIGRRWYRDYAVAGSARLNAPVARLVGREVTAVADFVASEGRVTLGDGSWPARGEATAGERLRVTAVEAGVLMVERETSPSPFPPAAPAGPFPLPAGEGGRREAPEG